MKHSPAAALCLLALLSFASAADHAVAGEIQLPLRKVIHIRIVA